MSISRALTNDDKDAILRVIGEAWKTRPEYRLGQLLFAMLHSHVAGPGTARVYYDRHIMDELFTIEDGDLAHSLSVYAMRNGPVPPASEPG
jgi:hypothetical protein